jgi:NAD(P)-dependent dehydrogenase (short-subunit alcohol dehydrogenase family)
VAVAKCVLITGASTGIGRVTAEFFAARGWNVAATMRSPERSDLGEHHANIRLVRLDVTDPASVEAAVAETIGAFGAIDVVVNNAGYGLVGPFEAQSDEQLRRQFDTNVFGMMNVIRAVLPHMRERKSGRIINVASIGGRMSLPLYSAYCSTKWAVEGFSEALSYELRQHNIKIKIIEPGFIKTDFFDRSLEIASRPGLTAYDEFVANVAPNIKAWHEAAAGPEVVARSIWRAANSIWPRLRYHPAGNLAILGRTLIPGQLYVRLLRRLLNAW